MIETTVDRFGHIDIVVNAAGIIGPIETPAERVTPEQFREVIDINLLGVVRGCQTFTPLLKEQRSGHIVNTASLAGLIHGPGMSSYNAAKAGVVALSETLGFELAPWGIHVSVICPAFFRTNLHESLQGKDTAVMTTLSRKMIGYALGRNPQASDRRLLAEMVRAGGDASFTDLAVAVATSRQFRYRADRQADVAPGPSAPVQPPVATGTSARAATP